MEGYKKHKKFNKIPTPETIKQSEKVTILQNIASPEQKYNKYVITQSDGRISLIRCVFVVSCSASTTWAGKFAIEYQFKSNHFDNMVDLDQSVIELFDQFTPTLIPDKE